MKKLTFLGLTVLVLGAVSCKKTGPTGPTGATGATGAAGPLLTGNLKGFVAHYDVDGAKISSNLAGDSVLLIGSNKYAVTDANGFYQFSGLNTGVYNLSIKRAGFGTVLAQDINFVGGGDAFRNVAISKIPTTNVSTFMAYDTTIAGVNYVRVKGTVPSAPNGQSMIVFVGGPGQTSVNSSISNYSSSYVITVNTSTASSVSYSRNILTSDLYDLGFVSGNTVYAAIYTIGATTSASSYPDLSNNKTVYTALGPNPLFASAVVQ